MKGKDIYLPESISTENKFDHEEGGVFEELTDGGKLIFNFMFEFMDRNPETIFATDIFKLTGFTNEQIIIVQKIINAAKYNTCVLAADFVGNKFGYLDIQ